MYTVVKVSKELAMQLKVLAIKNKMTLQELVEKFLTQGFKRLKVKEAKVNKK